jgi:hypothetical protein
MSPEQTAEYDTDDTDADPAVEAFWMRREIQMRRECTIRDNEPELETTATHMQILVLMPDQFSDLLALLNKQEDMALS